MRESTPQKRSSTTALRHPHDPVRDRSAGRQAAGSAVVYLDDETMLLSATTAAKHPKESLDFFPLTVDVEERMYAAGRIPGSFFRREGRPSEDAILTCRLIDRPLRPSFVKGLRNEIQVVVTVMALDPETSTTCSRSTLPRCPPSSPACRSAARSAAPASRSIEGQWVAFPTHSQLERPRFDMVVAGRVRRGRRRRDHDGRGRGDAEHDRADRRAARPPRPRRSSRRAWRRPSRSSRCSARRSSGWPRHAAKPTARVPAVPRLPDDVYAAVESAVSEPLAKALTIAGKQEREAELDRVKALAAEKLGQPVRGPREGDRGGVPLAHQEARPPAGPRATRCASTVAV